MSSPPHVARRGGAEHTHDSAAGPVTRAGTRLDIQALRAVAVMAVVIYHLWPGILPGGFVGVDVFLVISGFLITSHLLKSPPRRARDFGKFWARRILRLIPPVVVVIGFILACVIAFFPSALWKQMSIESIASMFYWQNWRLIAEATDYLNANAAPSPFQHFWSLSVEEQYYIFWPLLVAALYALVASVQPRIRNSVIVVGMASVALASFLIGLHMTSSAPAEAYFATYARMWELGVGSVLAAAAPFMRGLRRRPGIRVMALVVGYVGIAAALFLITESTPFPGWVAALPVLATALVIAAEDPEWRFNPRGLLHSRPVQLLGDTSYAIYLWHWPLLIVAGYAFSSPLGTPARLAILVLSIAVGWVSTKGIEAPVRNAPFLKNRTGRIFAAGAAASVIVLVGALGIDAHVTRAEAASKGKVEAQLNSDEECFGAGAADPKHNCPSEQELVTSPEFAKTDSSRGVKECLNWPPFPKLITCHVGPTSGAAKRVALFGNSHAGQWLPALEELAKTKNWAIDTYIAGICKPTDVPTPFTSGMAGLDPKGLTDKCVALEREMIDQIKSADYDLVLVSALDRDTEDAKAVYGPSLVEIAAAGPEVVVIRDTPAPMDQANQIPDCVAKNIGAPQACDGTPSKWIGPDPLAEAALSAGVPRVHLIGLNQLLCTDDICPAIIGGVIAYHDYNHLSTTMVKTLAPYLAEALEPIIK